MCVIFVLYVGVLVAYYIIICMLFGVKIYMLFGVTVSVALMFHLRIAILGVFPTVEIKPLFSNISNKSNFDRNIKK